MLSDGFDFAYGMKKKIKRGELVALTFQIRTDNQDKYLYW